MQAQREDGVQLVGDGDGLTGAFADDLADFRHRVLGFFPTDQVEVTRVGLEDGQLKAGHDHLRAALAWDQQERQPLAGSLGETE